MKLEKKECKQIGEILEEAKISLTNKNSIKLRALSNKITHSACTSQDSGSISMAIIIYSLGKLIDREDHKKIKSWDLFVKKFNGILDLAIKALKENNQDQYQMYVQQARKTIESHSIALKPYIQDVLKKSSINKGSKIHEHGISLEQTSKLLGISQWELSGYVGQKTHETKHAQTINVKTRAKMALEFFS